VKRAQDARPAEWRRPAIALAIGAAAFMAGWWLLQPGEAGYLVKSRVVDWMFANASASAQPQAAGLDYYSLAFAAVLATCAAYGAWRLIPQ